MLYNILRNLGEMRYERDERNKGNFSSALNVAIVVLLRKRKDLYGYYNSNVVRLQVSLLQNDFICRTE